MVALGHDAERSVNADFDLKCRRNPQQAGTNHGANKDTDVEVVEG